MAVRPARAGDPVGAFGVGGVLPVIYALTVRNHGSLSRELLRGAAEAPLGGLVLGERGRVAY
jgi:hypothetical protein